MAATVEQPTTMDIAAVMAVATATDIGAMVATVTVIVDTTIQLLLTNTQNITVTTRVVAVLRAAAAAPGIRR